MFSSGVGDFSDMKYVSSGSNTPSDADKEFLPTTPDNVSGKGVAFAV